MAIDPVLQGLVQYISQVDGECPVTLFLDSNVITGIAISVGHYRSAVQAQIHELVAQLPDGVHPETFVTIATQATKTIDAEEGLPAYIHLRRVSGVLGLDLAYARIDLDAVIGWSFT